MHPQPFFVLPQPAEGTCSKFRPLSRWNQLRNVQHVQAISLMHPQPFLVLPQPAEGTCSKFRPLSRWNRLRSVQHVQATFDASQPFSVLPQPAERNVQQTQATEPVEAAGERAVRSGHMPQPGEGTRSKLRPLSHWNQLRNVQHVQATSLMHPQPFSVCHM